MPVQTVGWRWGGNTASGYRSIPAIFLVIIINKPNMAAVYSLYLGYWTSMLWSIDTRQDEVSADQ